MTGLFREADERKLVGLDARLIQVVRRVALTGPHFIISEGLRTQQRQRELFREGKTKTLKSKHSLGLAVDCYPVVAPIAQLRWSDYRPLVVAAKQAAKELGVPMRFGYDWGWDAPHWEIN